MTDPGCLGPFGACAVDYAERRLAVVPCGGKEGKERLMAGLNRHMAPSTVEALIEKNPRFAMSNIGILTGPSGVTVIDIDADDVELLHKALTRFGATPVIVRTPRGGFHLWYRSTGEPCGNLKGEGLPIDIKGGGGVIIAPPSVRWGGKHDGRRYIFERGGLDDLQDLPVIKPDAIKGIRRTKPRAATPRPNITEGARNNTLFRASLRMLAGHHRYFDEMLAEARELNASFDPPMDDDEVIGICKSAWSYQLEGRNWVGCEPRVIYTRSDLIAFGGDGEALMLDAVIRANNGARIQRGEEIKVSPKAMARDEVIPHWTDARKYRRVRNRLEATGRIKRTHESQGDDDPHRFLAVNSGEERGAISAPDIMKHRPPGSGTQPFVAVTVMTNTGPVTVWPQIPRCSTRTP